MKLNTVLIAVRDMDKSLKFYHDIFDQEVTLDLGWNKGLSGGFALQLNFDQLVGFDESSMKWKTNNMELYFEVNDFDAFMDKLSHFDIEYVHKAKKYAWLQRVVRIYDPDFHMIEIGESMGGIMLRLQKEGKSVDEIVSLTQHPKETVIELLKTAQEEN